MPKRNLDEDVELKFDECGECVFAGRVRPCNGCDAGEFFEEVEPDGVDDLMRY